jgi:hypothetical protein
VSAAVESAKEGSEEPNEASCAELALRLLEWLKQLSVQDVSGKAKLKHMCNGKGSVSY